MADLKESYKTKIPCEFIVRSRFGQDTGKAFLVIAITDNGLLLVNDTGEMRFGSPNDYYVDCKNDFYQRITLFNF